MPKSRVLRRARLRVPWPMRVAATFAALAASVLSACGPPPAPKKLEMEPIGTWKNVPTAPLEEVGDAGVTAPNSATPAPGSPCVATEIDNLEEAIRQCEVPIPRGSDVPPIKDRLEVKVVSASPSVSPAGRLDLVVTVKNRGADPLVLFFTGEPAARFEVEAYDTKGRRVDLPSAKWPGYPKGQKPEPRETKTSKITLEKNGQARVRITWEAVKTKWAPDRSRTWEGRGYPRQTAGGLAPGKYLLRVVLPVVGEIDVAKVGIEVVP